MITWDYVAGFFDGEGCIYIDKQRRLHITFAQKSRVVLEKIQVFLTAEDIPSNVYVQFDKEHHGPFFHLTIGGNVISKRRFLSEIKDLVVVKRQKVEYALKFAEGIRVVNYHPPYGPKHERQIVEMYQSQGLSLRAIAGHFDRSVSNITYVLEKHAVPRRQHGVKTP